MGARDQCVGWRDEAIGLNVTACSGVKDVGAIEPGASGQLEHRLGEERVLVGWINPECFQGVYAVWVDCLGDEQAAGA